MDCEDITLRNKKNVDVTFSAHDTSMSVKEEDFMRCIFNVQRHKFLICYSYFVHCRTPYRQYKIISQSG